MLSVLTLGVFLAISTVCVDAHGRLWEPVGRGSEWRRGWPAPEGKKDYNDMELWCGGRGIQWNKNGGKCGVCGDDWSDPEPRDHEDGGKYDNGHIVQTYASGTLVEISPEVTANHLGWIEFRMCVRDDRAVQPLTHDCLNKHLLKNHKGETRFWIGDEKGFLKFQMQLPAGVTCKNCVIQWKYNTGNTWGTCPNGTGANGCAPDPEQFYGCADVEII